MFRVGLGDLLQSIGKPGIDRDELVLPLSRFGFGALASFACTDAACWSRSSAASASRICLISLSSKSASRSASSAPSGLAHVGQIGSCARSRRSCAIRAASSLDFPNIASCSLAATLLSERVWQLPERPQSPHCGSPGATSSARAVVDRVFVQAAESLADLLLLRHEAVATETPWRSESTRSRASRASRLAAARSRRSIPVSGARCRTRPSTSRPAPCLRPGAH